MKRDKVLIIGRDLQFEQLVGSAFIGEYQFTTCRSTRSAQKLTQAQAYDIIVFDEDILNSESFDGDESTSLLELYEAAIRANKHTVFFLVYLKNNTFIQSFKKQNRTTLLFHREHFNPSRMAYA